MLAAAAGLKPYRTAAECIDWSLPCPSIFERQRPLAEATLKRIARGVVRFLETEDEWYEGRYLNTIRFVPRRESPLFAWPLWLMNSGWIWSVRRHVPAGGTLVEIGATRIQSQHFIREQRLISS